MMDPTAARRWNDINQVYGDRNKGVFDVRASAYPFINPLSNRVERVPGRGGGGGGGGGSGDVERRRPMSGAGGGGKPRLFNRIMIP